MGLVANNAAYQETGMTYDLDTIDREAGRLDEDTAELIWYLTERVRTAERVVDAARYGDVKSQEFAELLHGYDEGIRR